MNSSKLTETVSLSVVIPCFNEETTVGEVVRRALSIGREAGFTTQVILVDNCSWDNSVEVAREAGALVLNSKASTVAAVRNEGARSAKGAVLLFLDADVILDESWGQRFLQISQFILDQRIVAGSHCRVPPDLPGFFSEWYRQIESDSRDTHVGSGHMLISSKLFKQLGGFNEELISGEDYEFCRRSESLGCKLVVDQKLIAYHLGYPFKISNFIKRERWHGKGDVSSIRNILRSKVAVAALVFGLLHILLFSSIFFNFILSVVIAFSILFYCFIVVVYKFRVFHVGKLFNLFPASYFYLLGRLLAFVP